LSFIKIKIEIKINEFVLILKKMNKNWLLRFQKIISIEEELILTHKSNVLQRYLHSGSFDLQEVADWFRVCWFSRISDDESHNHLLHSLFKSRYGCISAFEWDDGGNHQ